MTSQSLISCICITNNRPFMLDKAIACYISQDHPNKQLVISYPSTDLLTEELLKKYTSSSEFNILPIERPHDQSLGNARNDAIHKSEGNYICIWDDDDWHHPSRLTYQYEIIGKPDSIMNASILRRIFLFDSITQLAYLSFPYHWDGTLLCRKEMILQNQYSNTNLGEDTHITSFLERRKLLSYVEESPYIYIYVYHGNNTWSYEHFKYFLKKSILLNEEYTNKVRALVNH